MAEQAVDAGVQQVREVDRSEVRRWQAQHRQRSGEYAPSAEPSGEEMPDRNEGETTVHFTVAITGFGKIEVVEEAVARVLHKILSLNFTSVVLRTEDGRVVIDADKDKAPEGQPVFVLKKKT